MPYARKHYDSHARLQYACDSSNSMPYVRLQHACIIIRNPVEIVCCLQC